MILILKLELLNVNPPVMRPSTDRISGLSRAFWHGKHRKWYKGGSLAWIGGEKVFVNRTFG